MNNKNYNHHSAKNIIKQGLRDMAWEAFIAGEAIAETAHDLIWVSENLFWFVAGNGEQFKTDDLNEATDALICALTQ
jgi:hypothetical protein